MSLGQEHQLRSVHRSRTPSAIAETQLYLAEVIIVDAIEAILSRRSIRKYRSESVSADAVTTILQCAMAAPSAVDQQPWRFVLINEREVLDGCARIHPYAQMLKQASLAVLVCGDTSSLASPGYWPQDCAASTQNMLLAAHALGLGTCWCGVYPNEQRVAAFRKFLGIPDHVVPFSIVAVGHASEAKPPADRYDESLVHINRW